MKPLVAISPLLSAVGHARTIAAICVRHDSRIRFAEAILRRGHRSARRVTPGPARQRRVHREIGTKVVVSRLLSSANDASVTPTRPARYRTVNRVSVLHLRPLSINSG